MNEVKRIRVMLRSTFRGPAWHGPAVKKVLAGVEATTAAAHPIADTHSIWEMVLHMTYWRRVVVDALDGGTVDEHPPEELNWPAVTDDSPEAWQQAVAGLEASQKELVARLATLDDTRLNANVRDRDYSLYFLVHGILQHDIYHAGQIALLKKSAGER
ncbi:MAG: DinB family protein [Acidobacteriota bacterium]